MSRDRQRDLASAFRALHGSGEIILLPNAFDAASARLLAKRHPAAIGTTSAGIAWAAGYPDGEEIDRDEMTSAIGRIVSAVDIGVSADVEAGYGDAPADAADTAAAVIEVGAIGLNLEDAGSRHGQYAAALLPTAHAAEKIAAVRAVAQRCKLDLVINARTDVFLAATACSEEGQLASAIERGNAYLEAGADCVFIPGACSEEAIARLVSGIRGPVSIFVLPGVPEPSELARLGVARVSLGGGPYQACLALLDEIGAEFLESGRYTRLLSQYLDYPALQALMSR